MASHRFALIATLGLVTGLTCLPLLLVAAGPAPALCGEADAAAPTLLGSSTLEVAALQAWWASTRRSQPERLAVDIVELIALYVAEGELEGVRADLAFAEAIVETGYFTSRDTSRNNFAGIAHYDDATAGRAFATPSEGVRAHIQLLHKYAAGNDVALHRPDVAPDAGARAETWAQPAGTWATDPAYFQTISGVYDSMLAAAVEREPDGILVGEPPCTAGVVVGGYALPVDRHWYDEHPTWFTKPHHDYPAADIPVPLGSPVYAVTAGAVAGTTTTGRCGIGVVVNGDDGAQYTYCHGQPGSTTVEPSARVEAGDVLMLSASTGSSTGPHLHLGIRVDGERRCPQPLLVAIAERTPISPHDLPSSGCIG